MPTEILERIELQAPAPAGAFLEKEETSTNLANASRALDMYGFSQDFWIRHQDLLPEDTGLVLQASLSQEGRLIPIDTLHGRDSLMVLFDSRKRGFGQYSWQLTYTGNHGRSIMQLDTQHSGDNNARSYEFDTQGIVRRREEAEPDLVRKAAGALAIAVSHPLARRTVSELRARKNRAEADIQAFSVAGLTKRSPASFEREINKKQNYIDSIGFIALKPFEGGSN